MQVDSSFLPERKKSIERLKKLTSEIVRTESIISKEAIEEKLSTIENLLLAEDDKHKLANLHQIKRIITDLKMQISASKEK